MIKKKLLTSLLLAMTVLTGAFSLTARAATDDPGVGRLSGTDIPAEFYETVNPEHSSSLRRYGSFQTFSPYTNATYSHQDQFTGISIVNGIDVSEYQKEIDWAAVKAAGIDFAFIRVGARGWGSAGNMIQDSKYAVNIENAIAAGISVGVYVFSQATTTAEAEAEAQYLLDRVGTYNITLPYVLDFEFASTGNPNNGGRLRNANLSKEDATNICLAFCNKIAASGHSPMVYANPDMLNNHLNASTISNSYPVWLANYTTNTSYSGTFYFWQYSEKGTVSGITGNVDMNFYYQLPSNHLAAATVTPIPDQTYTGDAITPPVTVMSEGRTLVENQDYTVTYSNNQSVGTALATITGIYPYTGTRSISFQIIVNNTLSPSIRTRSKSYLKIGWEKQENVTGYEIYRSNMPNSNFKKIATISKASTTTYKDSGLASSECYYYKVRTFVKNSGGGKNYSEFSPVISSYTKSNPVKMALPKSNLNLYTSASTGSDAVAAVTKNTAMQIIYGTYDNDGTRWYYVKYESIEGTYKGFVPDSRVTVGKRGTLNHSKVNVRKSRSILSKRLTRLNKGKVVTVLSSKKKGGITWYKVRFQKGNKTYNGYISSAYVKIK